ncbi:MAG: signal peptidase I [Hirschia sp.]|nr:signal peptidase I [Hirschia sp.]MBF19241.1 signal peptidase I [Hirschia sp.]
MTMDVKHDTPEDETDPESGEEKLSGLQWWLNEAREMVMTVLVLLPFWLVFTSFIYELRVIPSESMVPTLLVGDRVTVAKFSYGYNRNSPALGIGRWFTKDDVNDPDERLFGSMPKRGDVVVFRHPNDNIVLIKRLIGMPGDTLQMKDGQLIINGEPVKREFVRRLRYRQKHKDADQRILVDAVEYRETLPNGVSYLTLDNVNKVGYENTPLFTIPEGDVFMMGDNRDNSEDSRSPYGHPELAREQPYGWDRKVMNFTTPTAIGYVPLDHLLGRADTVLFTLYGCKETETTVCFKPRLWSSFKDK